MVGEEINKINNYITNDSPVSMYENIYYTGSSSKLEVGNYRLGDLQNLNIKNDDI